jgi:hypothetical protein
VNSSGSAMHSLLGIGDAATLLDDPAVRKAYLGV